MIHFKSTQIDKDGAENRNAYEYKNEKLTPEQLAVELYDENNFQVLWAENDYWWTVMALLYWDVIFAPVEGAVVTGSGMISTYDDNFDQLFEEWVKRKNGKPFDFGTEHFYIERRGLIENKFKELSNKDLVRVIEKNYDKYHGRLCRPVNDWGKLSKEELSEPLHFIDNQVINAITLRLISDFHNSRQGLPDLLAWNEEEFRFVEVKNQNDSVSLDQKDWHMFLSEFLGVEVELFLINPSEAKEESIKSFYHPLNQKVKVSIGDTSSKYEDEAIDKLKEMPSYTTYERNDETRRSAVFEISRDSINDLFDILDLTNRWKSQEVCISGDKIDSTNLRRSLSIYKNAVNDSITIDNISSFFSFNAKFGNSVFNFRELQSNKWKDYGYIDSEKKAWVFSKKKIKEKAEQEIEKVKYDPFLKERTIEKAIEDLPEVINPKEQQWWAFSDDSYTVWFREEGDWVSLYGDSDFPGISQMVGVEKINQVQKAKARGYDNAASSVETTVSIDKQSSSSKGGSKSIGGDLVKVFRVISKIFRSF